MPLIKTDAEHRAVPSGAAFSRPLPKGMSWKERHAAFYLTAHREVTLTLFGGEKITGTLVETPGYFSRGTKAGPKAWLRIPGRKTRKPVDIRTVRHLKGFKAPTLAEAVEALIYLSSPGATAEQVATARTTTARM